MGNLTVCSWESLILPDDSPEPPRLTARPFDPESFECVYFLHALGTDLVKVGWTANLPERIRKIKTGCPHKLRLLAIFAGGREIETRYHRDLKPYRQTGEWFLLTATIRMLIVIGIRANHLAEWSPMVKCLESRGLWKQAGKVVTCG